MENKIQRIFILTAAFFGVATACSHSGHSDGLNKPGSEITVANDTCRIIDNYLTQLAAAKKFSGGLLIVKDGERIFSKGYGWANKEKGIPFTPCTPASMGSITKVFTAAAIMKLVEQEKLSIKDSLVKFFPNVPPDKAGITIHQLLTHSSGFHDFLAGDGGDYEKIETGDFLIRAFHEPLAFKPGEKSVYSNAGMSILGIIIEKVSGKEYEQFLTNELLEPIHIHTIGYHSADADNDSIAHGYQNGKDWGTIPQHIRAKGNQPYWNLKANGGLESSLNDIFLWTNAITNHKILSDSSIQRMFTAHIAEEGYGGQSWFGYGCTITKSRRATKVIDNGGSNGIYYARLIRLPEEGLVFYMVTNESSINTNMVLPNVTQLYFNGVIEHDALTMKPKFETVIAAKIYDILEQSKPSDLSKELEKENIKVEDDMVLLEVGQRLIEEQKAEEALSLYQYYIKTFPDIIVAWNDLGDVYQMIGNREEAIKCYRQALKLRPENQRAKSNLEALKSYLK